MILSITLINLTNTVFAAISQNYEECIQAFTSDKQNYSACDLLQQEAEKCFQDATPNCNAQYAQQKSLCEASLNTDCMDEVEKNIKDCISSAQNICITKEDNAKLCITKAEQNFESICRERFPEQTGSSNCGNGTLDEGEGCDDGNRVSGDGCDENCMTEETVPPSIPKINTLPGPNADTVGSVSPYLMSNFLPRIARTVISFGIGAAVLGLVLSSIGLLTAYGNEEKYGNAKKGMYFSLIGLVIALLAFAIVQLVFFTGFQIGNIT